jgi:bacteriorhodopsin
MDGSDMILQNMENFFSYTTMQYSIIAQVLTLGAAVHIAALVFFAATGPRIAPKYRLASHLSMVVMVSAGLELFLQYWHWTKAFEFNDALDLWEPGGLPFSNGFRYMNWSIDVPILLAQLVLVMKVTGRQGLSAVIKFTLAGWLMIWTGYIGQFYEWAEDRTIYWWMNGVSWIFYVYILFLVHSVIFKNSQNLMPFGKKIMHRVFWLFLIVWTFYAVCYMVPVFWPEAWGVVFRQILFTFADVTTKAVYGVILSWVLIRRSAEEGFEQAKVE